MAKLKLHLIIVLPAVFSIAGVLSLLTSPAQAAQDPNCHARALSIKDHTEPDTLTDAFSFFIPGDFRCPNPCKPSDINGRQITFFREIPGQGGPVQFPTGIVLATKYFYPDETAPVDVGWGPTLFGQIAFFCGDPSSKEVVVVGRPGGQEPSGEASSCPVILQEICTSQ